jgi:hypothetical protein
MKTIFDKVDTKYLECATGICEHAIHMQNGLLIVTIIGLMLFYRRVYAKKN